MSTKGVSSSATVSSAVSAAEAESFKREGVEDGATCTCECECEEKHKALGLGKSEALMGRSARLWDWDGKVEGFRERVGTTFG